MSHIGHGVENELHFAGHTILLDDIFLFQSNADDSIPGESGIELFIPFDHITI